MFFSILVWVKTRIQVSSFACLFFAGLSVGKTEITIQLTDTFQYPAQGESVTTLQINDSNMLVGTINSGTAFEGFYVNRPGQFSAPFSEPEDTENFTFANGINNYRALCGYYSDGVSTKGFVKMGETYSSFVAPVENVSATRIYSINDAGNFVGSYIVANPGARSVGKAFAVLDGVYTYLGIPGAVSEARGINNRNEIVGYYSYLSIPIIYDGYLRDSTGGRLMNVDFPGAHRTEAMAINDAGFVVGTWYAGVTSHGFLFQRPSTYISYDVPGADYTNFTGINNNGTICGIYAIAHRPRGFTAQIQTDE
jgi:hypothetical protein